MSAHLVELTYAGGTIDRHYLATKLDLDSVDELDDQILCILQFEPFARFVDTLQTIDAEFSIFLILHDEFRDAPMSISVSSLADRSGSTQERFDACVYSFKDKFSHGNQYAYYFDPLPRLRSILSAKFIASVSRR